MDNLHYDAFISYRHTQVDSFVAKKIHHMLEHYKIPKKIQQKSGKKKIERVFRDHEELPLSADLSEEIVTALKNSEYLILVCSPESLESRWVQNEVKLFSEMNGNDRILTVLVNGEPEEAFPEILCQKEETVIENGEERIVKIPVEPLAADVRGNSPKLIEQKLKTEILRILAPMLSCTYDELRQRHREYKLKCAFGIIGLVLCFTAAFLIYALWQAKVIEEQYQNAKRNQARYLCNVSKELLASGDREGAIKTALALTNDDENEALVPEQIYALNNALYSYQCQNSIYLRPNRELKTDFSVLDTLNDDVLSFSPRGNFVFAIDKMGKVYFFSSKDGKCVYSCMCSDFKEIEDESFIHGIMVSEQQAVLLTKHSVVYLDIIEKKILNCFEIELGYGETSLNYPEFKVHKNYIAIHAFKMFKVYDYTNGECLFSNEKGPVQETYSWEIERVIEGDIEDFVFSPSGKEIAVTTISKDHSEDGIGTLAIYSLETGELNLWQVDNCEQRKICYINDGLIATMWISFFTDEMATLGEYTDYFYAAYDVETQEIVWEGSNKTIIEQYSDFEISCVKMSKSGENQLENMVVTCVGNEVKMFRGITGEEISHVEANETVISFQQLDNTRFFVATSGGETAVSYVGYTGKTSLHNELPEEIEQFLYNPYSATAIFLMKDSGRIMLYDTPKDHYMTENQGYVEGIGYFDTAEKYYRVETVNPDIQGQKTKITFWDMQTKQLVGQAVAESENLKMEFWDCMTLDGEEYALYSTSNVEYQMSPQTVYLQKIYGDDIVYKVQLENIPEHMGTYYETRYDDNFQIVCSEKSETAAAYLKWENYFEIFDLRTGERILPFEKIFDFEESGYYVESQIEASKDGKYYIIYGKYVNYNENRNYCYIKLWDIENSKWKMIDGEECFEIEISETQAYSFFSDNIVIGPETMQAAIYLEENEIVIVDLNTGTITQRIPFLGKDGHVTKFFEHEQYLLFWGDEGVLTMWDLQGEKAIMTDIEKLNRVNNIYTDESAKYFGITTSHSTGGYTFCIYYVDDNYRFYHFADVEDGFASFLHEEVFCLRWDDVSYYTKFYDYITLKTRAEQLIGDTELTETEKRMYYLTEE